MITVDVPEMDGAVCAATSQPDVFFANDTTAIEQARSMCRRCPAIRECLAWALEHKEYGVWAGTTETQRDALINQHRRTA